MSTRNYLQRPLAPSVTALALSMAVGMSAISWPSITPAGSEAEPVVRTSQNSQQTLHKTVEIDGVKVFYREAGLADAPTILYKRDLVNLDFHLLDTGHFALEEDARAIASHIRRFLGQQVASKSGPKHEG